MKRKFIYAAPLVCLAISLASTFFLPRELFKLFIPITSFVLSVIVSYLIVSYAFSRGKKRIIVTRFVLVGLMLLAILAHIGAWNKYVCKVTTGGKIENGHFSSFKKYIITGRKLLHTIETDDPVIIELNKGNLRCSICDSLNKRSPELLWQPQSIVASRIKFYGSFLFLTLLVSVLLIFVLMELLLRNILSTQTEDKVFISYNHDDETIADELLSILKQHHIKTVIDKENMIGGYDINQFARESVSTSRITLLIVSEHSLLSGWVVTETVNTFFKEALDKDKYFIACYIDKSFLDPNFTIRALAQINEKIEKVIGLIKEQDALGSDTRQLNDQKSRLILLRNNLDTVLQRLNTSKSIDISEGKLRQAIPEILLSIKTYFDKEVG